MTQHCGYARSQPSNTQHNTTSATHFCPCRACAPYGKFADNNVTEPLLSASVWGMSDHKPWTTWSLELVCCFIILSFCSGAPTPLPAPLFGKLSKLLPEDQCGEGALRENCLLPGWNRFSLIFIKEVNTSKVQLLQQSRRIHCMLKKCLPACDVPAFA